MGSICISLGIGVNRAWLGVRIGSREQIELIMDGNSDVRVQSTVLCI